MFLSRDNKINSKIISIIALCKQNIFLYIMLVFFVHAVFSRYGGEPIAEGQRGVSAAGNGGHEVSFAARETAPPSEPKDTPTQGHRRGAIRCWWHGRDERYF